MFDFTRLKQDTVSLAYKDQNSLTLHLLCNEVDALYNITRKHLEALNRDIIASRYMLYRLQKIL